MSERTASMDVPGGSRAARAATIFVTASGVVGQEDFDMGAPGCMGPWFHPDPPGFGRGAPLVGGTVPLRRLCVKPSPVDRPFVARSTPRPPTPLMLDPSFPPAALTSARGLVQHVADRSPLPANAESPTAPSFCQPVERISYNAGAA